MSRNDWLGLFTSLALHALLFVVLALITAARPEPEPLGFIEVELGPFAQGRPVQRAEEDRPRAEAKRPEPVPPKPETKAAPPKEAKPVKLPEQRLDLPDPEKVEAPETDKISPETNDTRAEVERTEPEPESTPTPPPGSGAREGTAGAADGQEGSGNEETKTAPYVIEGLNRDALFAPPPAYREKVNATIKFRIVVDPRGQVVSAVPVLKASPALESAVRDVLMQRWRFNPLPGNAPQVNQTGTVTFRFRLE